MSLSSDNPADKVFVNAVSLGPEALRFISSPNPRGRVIAVLKDAIYVESDKGYVVCVGRGEAVEGPLTVIVPSFDRLRSAPQVREDAEVTTTLHSIIIGGTAYIIRRFAEWWSPELPRKIGSAEARQDAVDELKSYLTPVQTRDTSLVEARIQAALYDFQQAVSAHNYDLAANAICSLLGLGEGLTPEGDDVAMGLLASMVWQSRRGILDARNVNLLAQVVRAFAVRDTDKISARLLHHAGDGLLYAPAMKLGEALLAGKPDEVNEPLQRLLTVGSTTGRAVALGLLHGALLKTK